MTDDLAYRIFRYGDDHWLKVVEAAGGIEEAPVDDELGGTVLLDIRVLLEADASNFDLLKRVMETVASSEKSKREIAADVLEKAHELVRAVDLLADLDPGSLSSLLSASESVKREIIEPVQAEAASEPSRKRSNALQVERKVYLRGLVWFWTNRLGRTVDDRSALIRFIEAAAAPVLQAHMPNRNALRKWLQRNV